MDDLMVSALGEMLAQAERGLEQQYGKIFDSRELGDAKGVMCRTLYTFEDGAQRVVSLIQDGDHYRTYVTDFSEGAGHGAG